MSDRRLSPFPVDPELVERMHPMEQAHVEQVCRLHHAAMGRSLWAQLGMPFLRQVYGGLVDHPDFVGFVYVEEGRVRGFIAGSSNGPRMLHQVMDLWQGTDFRLLPHASGAVAIIAGADDIVAMLEESQVTVGTIRGSRYVTPIKVSGTCP